MASQAQQDLVVDRLLAVKPDLALLTVPSVLGHLTGTDEAAQESAMEAAGVLHGRALFALALESDNAALERYAGQMHQIHIAARGFLMTGCPGRPKLFAAAARWAKSVVLTQTLSPLLLRARIPPELRGASCLQDLPHRAVASTSTQTDPTTLRQTADTVFKDVVALLERPPQGTWQEPQLKSLLSCLGTIGRQRPPFLPEVLDCWRRSSRRAAEITAGGEEVFRSILRKELRTLLASNLIGTARADISAFLRSEGVKGSLEDLSTEAKYNQILAAAGVPDKEVTSAPRPKKRARREPPKKVWVGGEGDLFDDDALLSGEAEAACRRYEDIFGLPSQREPAGHVAGPALLASRVSSSQELARITLTALSTLSLKRSQLRDKAYERAVTFSDLGAGPAPVDGNSAQAEDILAMLLRPLPEGAQAAPAGAAPVNGVPAPPPAATDGKDPRSLKAAAGAAAEEDALATLASEEPLLSTDASTLKLSSDGGPKDSLALRLFEELLEAYPRLESSLQKACWTEEQVEGFAQVSRQVALHLVAGFHVSVGPALQKAMCLSYMRQAFEELRIAFGGGKGPPARGATGGPQATVALNKLVELFFSKFTADVARWQEAGGHAMRQPAIAANKTPLREILEGKSQRQRNQPAAFTYGELFDLFVAEFEKRQLPRREMRTFLNQIPIVPVSAFKMLEEHCQTEASRTVGLLTVLSLIETKPACRWRGLQLLFKLAYSAGGTEEQNRNRHDAIRFIINKVYSGKDSVPMRWQLPHYTDAEVVQLGSAVSASWFLPEDDEFMPMMLLRCRCIEDFSTMMLRSMVPSNCLFDHALLVPNRLGSLQAEILKDKGLCVPKDRIWLYLALCIKRPLMLHGLVETFTKCDVLMKEHLVKSVEEAIKHIPIAEPELLVLVQRASEETEPLVLKVLNILMQTSRAKNESLSPAYGPAVTRLYAATRNPLLLVPVFDLLDRKSLLDFLPAVLQLEKDQVKDAFQQLIASKAPPLSVTELLTELHHMNSPGDNIVDLKFSMQALNIIFEMRESFDSKVYGIVIQSLVEEHGPLPTLFMRTVIQVAKELPRLADFIVMEILPRLVRQEVWSNSNMWRGFMLVLETTFTSQPGAAARVLAMLPMSQLEDVLVKHPEWRVQLREYVARQPANVIAPHVRQLLT